MSLRALDPIFSVITPTFNGETTLVSTIESVLSQTEPSLEHLLVDDCSTDGTEQLIEAYGARDERVRFIRMEANSGGPAGPKATGVDAARGEFVAFCDQDDHFDSDKLARFLWAFREFPDVDVVFSDYRVFDDSGAYWAVPYLRKRQFTTVASDYLKRMRDGVYRCDRLYASMLCGVATGLATVATVVRRSALTAQPYTFCGELRIADDIDLWARLAKDCRLLFLDEPLSNYFWGANTVSSSAKNAARYADETLTVWRRTFAAAGSSLIGTERRRAKQYGAMLMYNCAKHSQNVRERRRLSLSSLRTSWNPLAAKLLISSLVE